MEHATIIGGFGGQGLLFAGHVLAVAALLEDRAVSWMPSYGPEMRGGTASCTVIIADRPIGSPIVDRADIVIALNPPSLAKFEPLLVPGGLAIVNTTLIEAEPRRTDIDVIGLPCSALARASGDDRSVSVVALGGLVAARPIVRRESIRQALRDIVGEQNRALIDADVEAFERGYEAVPPGLRPTGRSARGVDDPAPAQVEGVLRCAAPAKLRTIIRQPVSES